MKDRFMVEKGAKSKAWALKEMLQSNIKNLNPLELSQQFMEKKYIILIFGFFMLIGLMPDVAHGSVILSETHGDLSNQKENDAFSVKIKKIKKRKPIGKSGRIIIGILLILLGLFLLGNALILFAFYSYIYPPEVFILIVGILVLCTAIVSFIGAVKMFRKTKRKLVF